MRAHGLTRHVKGTGTSVIIFAAFARSPYRAMADISRPSQIMSTAVSCTW
jgi:hypothetical protein